MVNLLAVSIFLLSMVTILGSEFWNDVDKKHDELTHPEDLSLQATVNDLSGPEDLPTQATTCEVIQVESSPERPLPNYQIHISTPPKRMNPKHVSFYADEMVSFEMALTIDPTYPTNLSQANIVDKLMILGGFHEWPQLRLYDVENYSKYWAKVCIFFSEIDLTGMERVVCGLTPTFEEAKLRKTEYRGLVQSFDLLGCNCHGYQFNYNATSTSKKSFLIHQSSANEFFVFEHRKHSFSKRMFIRNFKGGVTLPSPTNPDLKT